MLIVASALKGYAIAAKDGRIGTVSDFLFDETSWKIRWLVVDTGTWLTDRKVLIHPSKILVPDYVQRELGLSLTKAEIEQSPDITQDEPVSRQMDANLYGYYGLDPLWGGGYFGMEMMMGSAVAPAPYFSEAQREEAAAVKARIEDADPHLRSISAVTGYYIHATDGDIGHVENFLFDDAGWGIRYIIIDTRNWWPGRHVLMSPYAVREISWAQHQIRLDVTCAQIKSSPVWNPLDMIDRVYEKRLHGHYGWQGYGW